MNNTKKNKSNKLKIVINLLILVMTVFVIVLLGSFFYQVFFSEKLDSSVFERSDDMQYRERIQISVLNGCGVDGLARKAKKYMGKRGFDVVEYGNYDTTATKSFVIDRIGNIDAALRSADCFGINDSLIITNIDSNQYLVNTIVIGQDYKKMEPFK